MIAVVVMLAAGVGAVCRYVADEVVEHRTRGVFPTGTLVVNLSGAIVLGVVAGMATHHGLSAHVVAVVGSGFAGGYTTFSTWAWESVALVEMGARREAVANVVLSYVLGLVVAAAALGVALLW